MNKPLTVVTVLTEGFILASITEKSVLALDLLPTMMTLDKRIDYARR